MSISKIDPAGLDVGQIGGRRNLIINGAMQVAQRGTSNAFSTDSYGYIIDRFEINNYIDDTVTVSQSSTAPDGFANSMKYAFSSGDNSLAAGDYLAHFTKFEGQDLQQLKKGTANAESVTLSFWIRSSVTGTYIAELYDNDNTRQISQSYTVDAADTWEKKELTFSGDTTGAFGNDNNLSMWITWWFAAGSTYSGGTLNTSWASATNANRAVGQVNAAASSGNEIYITGVQLEVGTVATPFEHRSYGEELALCQRYFWRQSYSGSAEGVVPGGGFNTNEFYTPIRFSTIMRADPACSVSDAGHFQVLTNNAARTPSSFTFSQTSTYSLTLLASVTITLGHYGWLRFGTNSSAYIQADAEL